MQNHGFSVFFFSVWLTIACQTTGFTKSTNSLFAILRTYKKTLCFLCQKKKPFVNSHERYSKERIHSSRRHVMINPATTVNERKNGGQAKRKRRVTLLSCVECQNKKKEKNDGRKPLEERKMKTRGRGKHSRERKMWLITTRWLGSNNNQAVQQPQKKKEYVKWNHRNSHKKDGKGKKKKNMRKPLEVKK